MITNRKEDSAHLQSDFYREKYHNILTALLISICIMVILISGIIYFVLFRAPSQYYATTPEGRIMVMPKK